MHDNNELVLTNNNDNFHQVECLDIVCFGGEDWWYHNRGHIGRQLMRQFPRIGATLYVNSIVMQKPKFNERKRLIQRLAGNTKSITKGLKKSDAGFWVYSPLSLPTHHISWLRQVNNVILQAQLWLVTRILKMREPIV